MDSVLSVGELRKLLNLWNSFFHHIKDPEDLTIYVPEIPARCQTGQQRFRHLRRVSKLQFQNSSSTLNVPDAVKTIRQPRRGKDADGLQGATEIDRPYSTRKKSELTKDNEEITKLKKELQDARATCTDLRKRRADERKELGLERSNRVKLGQEARALRTELETGKHNAEQDLQPEKEETQTVLSASKAETKMQDDIIKDLKANWKT